MLIKRDEGGEIRPSREKLEGGSFDDLAAVLADGTITRSRAIKLAGAALLGGAFTLLWPGEADALNKKKRRRRRRRRRKKNVTSSGPVDFGDTNINLPPNLLPTENVTISNIGPDTVELRPVLVGDGFTLVDGATFTLAPNDTKVLQVTFDPDNPLLYEGELKIYEGNLVVENVDLLGQGINL